MDRAGRPGFGRTCVGVPGTFAGCRDLRGVGHGEREAYRVLVTMVTYQ